MAKRFLIWYWSPTGGGGSQYAVKLAQRLALRFGDESVTLSLHADDPSVTTATACPFRTLTARVVTARRRPAATAVNLAANARVLAEHEQGVDCVIVAMNFATAAPLAMTLRKPLVYVAHDPHPHPGDYAPLLQRTTQSVLLRKSACVLAMSNYAAAELSRVANVRGKLEVAPLSAVFEPREAQVHKDGPLRLLFAGRMIKYKGLDILIDALQTLDGRDDWRLRVRGSGPALDAATVQRLELPQVERVSREWLSEAALEAEIAACDIVLAPYRSATQSGVIAQALAHGKPCVVTPVGGLSEQIGDGAAGWVAQRPDAIALAECLSGVLDHRKEIAGKARKARELAQAAWQGDYWAWLERL